MVFRELIKNEDGYTISELLVALTLVSIVLALASSVFLFVNKQMNAWQTNMAFYTNYHIVQNNVYNEVLNAEYITRTDTSLSVTKVNNEVEFYNWKDGIIQINGANLAISEVDSLIIQEASQVLIPEVYSWSVFQRKEEKTLTQDFVIHLRKPILWEPLSTTNSEVF